MFNKKILISLIEDVVSSNSEDSYFQLKVIGLLLERETYKRYDDTLYFDLFNRNKEVYNLKLDESSKNYLIYFLFYILYNKPEKALFSAWSLGKCYNCDIKEGMLNGLKLYKNNDQISLQLARSLYQLYDFVVIEDIKTIVFSESLKDNNLSNTKDYLEELSSLN